MNIFFVTTEEIQIALSVSKSKARSMFRKTKEYAMVNDRELSDRNHVDIDSFCKANKIIQRKFEENVIQIRKENLNE